MASFASSLATAPGQQNPSPPQQSRYRQYQEQYQQSQGRYEQSQRTYKLSQPERPEALAPPEPGSASGSSSSGSGAGMEPSSPQLQQRSMPTPMPLVQWTPPKRKISYVLPLPPPSSYSVTSSSRKPRGTKTRFRDPFVVAAAAGGSGGNLDEDGEGEEEDDEYDFGHDGEGDGVGESGLGGRRGVPILSLPRPEVASERRSRGDVGPFYDFVDDRRSSGKTRSGENGRRRGSGGAGGSNGDKTPSAADSLKEDPFLTVRSRQSPGTSSKPGGPDPKSNFLVSGSGSGSGSTLTSSFGSPSTSSLDPFDRESSSLATSVSSLPPTALASPSSPPAMSDTERNIHQLRIQHSSPAPPHPSASRQTPPRPPRSARREKSQQRVQQTHRAPPDNPQHSLAVTSLAIDTSTLLASHPDRPRGILYSGGRDGLLIGWELDMGMKKRRRGYGNENKRRRGGWDMDEDDEDEDEEEEEGGEDGSEVVSWGRRNDTEDEDDEDGDGDGDEEFTLRIDGSGARTDGGGFYGRRKGKNSKGGYVGAGREVEEGNDEEHDASRLPVEDRWEIDEEWLDWLDKGRPRSSSVSAQWSPSPQIQLPSSSRSSVSPPRSPKGANIYLQGQAFPPPSAQPRSLGNGNRQTKTRAWDFGSSDVPSGKATFRQCVHPHTDWVNDMVLCNGNRTVISASSDRTIMAWSPHSEDPAKSMTPDLLGTHQDYVRCLAHSRDLGWVVSGGLDRKIKIWDVMEGRETSIVSFPEATLPKSSIYSLAVNSSGTTLAAGTPEKVIRVWDPRTTQRTAKLVGHTDNVRALVLSEDGRHLLSASSDSTVKLWSLSMHRCIHTFNLHSTSVWSLFSQHPNLDIFYSGDRSGVVCKVDMEGCADVSEGECVVLCKEGEDGGRNSRYDPGINRILARDDGFVWTASGSSSIKRWRDVKPRRRRTQIPSSALLSTEYLSHGGDTPTRANSTERPITPDFISRSSSPYATYKGSNLASGLPSLSNSPEDGSAVNEKRLSIGHTVSFAPIPTDLSLASRHEEHSPHSHATPTRPHPTSLLKGHRPSQPSVDTIPRDSNYHVPSTITPTLFQIPYDSLVPLSSPDDPYAPTFIPYAAGAHDPEVATLYSAASVLSVPGLLNGHRHHSPSLLPSAYSSHPFAAQPHRSMQPGVIRPQSPDGQPLLSTSEPEVQTALTSRQEFEERESASDAIPLRSAPDQILEGREGLLRSEVLNDRRHVLTVDTAGDVALWDILAGRCIGKFVAEDILVMSRRGSDASLMSSANGNSVGSSDSSGTSESRALLEAVRARIEGEAATPMWCDVDTRTGSLAVHLDISRCFDAEIYADEAALDSLADYKDDQRINHGKWVLRNLFADFIDEEIKTRSVAHPSTTSPPSRLHRFHAPTHVQFGNGGSPPGWSSGRTQSNVPRTPGMTIALATPALTPALKTDLSSFPMGRSVSSSGPGGLGPIPGTPRQASSNDDLATPLGGPRRESDGEVPPARAQDYFSLPQSTTASMTPKEKDEQGSNTPDGKAASGGKSSPASDTPAQTGFFSKLKTLGRNARKPGPDKVSQPVAVPDTESGNYEGAGQGGFPDGKPLRPLDEEMQDRALYNILSQGLAPIGPDEAPPIHFPEDTAIMVSEEAPESGGVWSITYRGLVSTTGPDMRVLEMRSPLWLLNFLLTGNYPAKDIVKLAFCLQPWQSPEAAGLPDLPSGNARLTANRYLRARKMAAFVADKLALARSELSTSGASLPGSREALPIPPANALPRQSPLAAWGRRATGEQVPPPNTPPGKGFASLASSPPNLSNLSHSSASFTTMGSKDTYDGGDDSFEIELLCNEVVVRPTMTLAAIKQYIFRQPGDVLIHYRKRVK